jgi:hypothetical protein
MDTCVNADRAYVRADAICPLEQILVSAQTDVCVRMDATRLRVRADALSVCTDMTCLRGCNPPLQTQPAFANGYSRPHGHVCASVRTQSPSLRTQPVRTNAFSARVDATCLCRRILASARMDYHIRADGCMHLCKLDPPLRTDTCIYADVCVRPRKLIFRLYGCDLFEGTHSPFLQTRLVLADEYSRECRCARAFAQMAHVCTDGSFCLGGHCDFICAVIFCEFYSTFKSRTPEGPLSLFLSWSLSVRRYPSA